MTCSVKTTLRRSDIRRHPAISFPARPGRAFWLGFSLAGSLLAVPVVTAAPSSIQNDFSDNAVLATLPDVSPNLSSAPKNVDELADEVQQLIGQARKTGDPRFLGYAERLLGDWPEPDFTDRLRVLRATLAQSLHRFDLARQDLERVLQTTDQRRQRIQSRLTLANLELVQGRYVKAREHCQALADLYPGLIAASCLAQTEARTGRAESAYRRLRGQLASASNADPTSQLWAEGTLGDLAAQLGLDSAAVHWGAVLQQSPDDLYTRAQLADWQLQASNLQATLALTKGYDQVDALAVIRAIALREAGAPEAEALADSLRERFAEAQWRGTLLHQRDFARFQLDIENRPALALKHALANWETQREPLDTRLVLRAAQSAADQSALKRLQQWLAQYDQTDHRYPETP
ncbi:tetratricopeptide repeat protein [Marinobacter alexandrii]|uniref:hypothetical protein n=1 Tax=Marinobacter alexandrii TaxID=2570351 RepID=UPI001D19356E|nr:hypothetical protein [Marinobacter alexandrii]